MKWNFDQTSVMERAIDALVVPVFEGTKMPKSYKEIDGFVGGVITRAVSSSDFDEKANSTHLLYPTVQNTVCERVILLGLGNKKKFTLDVLRKAIGSATIMLQGKKIVRFGLVLPEEVFTQAGNKEIGEFIARGVHVGMYSFDQYKTGEGAQVVPVEEVMLIDVSGARQKGLRAGLESGDVIGESITVVRQLGNLPPQEMTPTYLANQAKAIAKAVPGLRCTVLEKDQIIKEGMGGLLGVASGSAEPPKFIMLEYNGTGSKKTKPIVLVGKGITFDSGGISIKPSHQMDEMKYDMLGGATVIGALRTAAALKLKKHVIGLVPATENLSGAAAYRPGDILKAANGKTIEVLNTDAEGRLILADALSYAQRLEPKYVVDLATLTGACLVALGMERAALFSEEEKLLDLIEDAAEKTGDQVWQLPLGPEYTEMITSKIADVKNIGGKYGGTCTAAAFLQQFTDYPWAHLDIAGTGWNMKPKPWIRAGATGYGVHLLTEFLRKA